MSNGPEFSPPQIHRISAFLFFELWPRVVEKLPTPQSPLERLRWLMYGLAVCDYTAFPQRRDERSKRDFLASFDQGTEITLHIANETLKEKKRWFSQTVDVIAKNSNHSGFQLWWRIVAKADKTLSGDYWGSVDFQEFFERSYALKITTEKDTTRFRNALKSKRSRIRKAEESHKKIFEDLIIDCAVEAEALEQDFDTGEDLRRWFEQDRSDRIAQYLGIIFEAHSNATRTNAALRRALASLHRTHIPTFLLALRPSPPSSKQETE